MKYNLPKLIFREPIEEIEDFRVTLKGEAEVLTVPRSSKIIILLINIIKYNI